MFGNPAVSSDVRREIRGFATLPRDRFAVSYGLSSVCADGNHPSKAIKARLNRSTCVSSDLRRLSQFAATRGVAGGRRARLWQEHAEAETSPLGRVMPINISDYADFASRNSGFLVLYSSNFA